MRIIISPAKKMNVDVDSLECLSMPVFLEETTVIKERLQSFSMEELQKIWNCNDSIAGLNYGRVQSMNLTKRLTPAILSYEGIQYQYMAPTVFEDGMLSYIQNNLRILSGFYGVLKPMDGVTPYRLEMQAKLEINGRAGLYEFWGDRLYNEVRDETRIIINLASKEYSKAVEKYLQPQDTFITCVFGELSGGKVVQKGTYAKMARGEMVRFMAEENIIAPEEMKRFNRLGYEYAEEFSDDCEYVFLKG